jgi:hypothetical protein
MVENTTTIDFNGITLTLKFGPWAIAKFADEMSQVILKYPDFDIKAFGEISAATILSCGHWNHCFEADFFPRIYNWEDFYKYVKPRLDTDNSEQLKSIFNLFMKLQEEYLKTNSNGQ